MSNKSKIKFDELDIKCLQEMPLILDVMANVGNKIGKLFSGFYEQLDEVVKANLKGEWQKDEKESYATLIYPFGNGFNEKKLLFNLEPEFNIHSATSICIKKEKKRLMGLTFYCTYSVDEYDNYISFWAIINQLKKEEKILYSLEFYQNLKEKITKNEVIIMHPDEEKDSHEYIEMKVIQKDFSKENLEQAFEDFKTEIVIPFLENLPE